ncbi:uncharacterized protein LOC135115637 [Scylla paramamosain]|uniref:uncharacterized protein LOC135115637 n=1 Tax=Scylla paramamosain TaxID=85552 RepID=UPI003083383D
MSIQPPPHIATGSPLLTSSINDLTGEAAVLETAIKGNDTYQVKRLLELHHDKFQIDLHGSILDKWSCDTGSRCVSQDVEILLRKSQTLIDRRGEAAAAVRRGAQQGGVLSLGGGGGTAGTAPGPRQRLSPRVSPTSVLSVDRRSLNTGHGSLMGSPSPRSSPRASPRGSPRGSPRCSPRSGSPRPFSRPSSPLAGCDRGSPRAPSPRAASPIHFVPPPVPYSDPEVRLRPRPLPRQFGVGDAARVDDERGRSRADVSAAARKEPHGLEARSDSVKKVSGGARPWRNGASEERPRTGIGSEQSAAAAAPAGRGAGGGERGKEKSRSPGTAEGRSIIKEDPRPEMSRDEGVARKDSSTRRVSWVPGVTDKAAASRDKPAYKRRHSAVVKSSEVTFQRQRSFSLDSQQQVRLTVAGSASWLLVPRPVISTENSTTRLAEPRGERDRSEPRYFTFSDVHPCTWEGAARPGTTSSSRRHEANSGAGDPSATSRFLVLNPDVPRERLVTYTSSEGTRLTFADLYTRDYLYTLPVLFLAAARGHSAITYLLLKYGASAGVTDTFGNTPLHLAACQMHVAWESVLDLLEFGAPISRPNTAGTTPLHLQPALVKLQEQLVLDCLATFEPPARPEPDPVTSSSRDLAAAPVRQSSNLLRRLQGVTSRDKSTTAAAAAATACPAAATAAPAAASSSLRGRVAAGRAGAVRGEREEDAGGMPSAEPSAALLTTSGSIRSRGGSATGPGPDYRSKELTWETLSHLGSRRRIRQLHEEGMDSEDGAKTTVAEAERSIALLKRLSGSVECLGFITRHLLTSAANILDFYERCTEAHLHTCFSSLLHHLLKNILELLCTTNGSGSLSNGGGDGDTAGGIPGAAGKRGEGAAALCLLVKLCACLLAGVQELQFTAMTTLNKVIDAAVVHRIGDLSIDLDHHLLPPGSSSAASSVSSTTASAADRRGKVQPLFVGVTVGRLARQDSRTGSVVSSGGEAAPPPPPPPPPGTGAGSPGTPEVRGGARDGGAGAAWRAWGTTASG